MKITTNATTAIQFPSEPQPTGYSTPGTTQPQTLIQSEKDIFFAPYRASGRPQGDRRTADQIINQNRIFKNLPSSIPLEQLYKHLGDWTSNNTDPQKRADAAYNAARVFNYIDGIDVKESARAGDTKGDGRLKAVDLWDGSTEAARLNAFAQKGYYALEDHGIPLASDNERITTTKPTHPTGRPWGDTRSAKQIFNASPIVNRFVEDLADHPDRASILNNLKALAGDWSDSNPNANSKADAAYNISKVANYLDAHPGFYRLDESFDNIGPGYLTGLATDTVNSDTEAAAFIDFSQKGYSALPAEID